MNTDDWDRTPPHIKSAHKCDFDFRVGQVLCAGNGQRLRLVVGVLLPLVEVYDFRIDKSNRVRLIGVKKNVVDGKLLPVAYHWAVIRNWSGGDIMVEPRSYRIAGVKKALTEGWGKVMVDRNRLEPTFAAWENA